MTSRALFSLLLKANQLKLEGKEQAALKVYFEILERYGESAELLAAIADCYFSLALGNPNETGENHERAIVWMKRAVALAPKNARLHAHLAQFYALGTLEYERAAEEYRRALELNPYDARTLFNAASLYDVPEEVVTLEEAIDWLERAVQLEPDEPVYHARLGELYYKAGRVSDAEREWLSALLCPRPLDQGYIQTIKEGMGIGKETAAQ